MARIIITLVLLLLPAFQGVAARSGSRDYTDMPVVVLYCDEDPGRINPGGGKGPAPQQLIDEGLCTPAEGVALTFVLANNHWDFESDGEDVDWDVKDDGWFARCDTDAEGQCALNSPVGFDILIGVVLHESTVKPGYTPAFFPATTHNFTEFTGYGLALVPEYENVTPDADIADHQTLALKIIHNGEPGNILTEWKINGNDDDDIYLATNADGWVSNVIAPRDRVELDFINMNYRAGLDISCSAVDDPSADVGVHVDRHGDVAVRIPDTDSDIRCDVVIND